jgi:DNA-binding transcriptional MerR regulator
MGEYVDTTSTLARLAEVTAPTVALYADLGLLDYIRASNGMRLFRSGQAARVREIYVARIASRGRKPGFKAA